MFFAVFKNLKSSFSVVENAIKMVKVIPLNAKNKDEILR